MIRNICRTALLCLTLLPTWLAAATLEEILALDEEPTGVVIEIVESNADDLLDLMPGIRQASDKIRKKFPGLSIAVVSHGYEQFSLTTKSLKSNTKLKGKVDKLVSSDIDVHVCGTHASWYGVTPEDFPDYINVSASGPAQINNYLSIGYIQLEL